MPAKTKRRAAPTTPEPITPTDPTTAVYQRMAEGWDPACKTCERLRRPCGAHPRDIKTALKIQDKANRDRAIATAAPERASTPRARAVPAWIEKEAPVAEDFDSRSLFCSRILAKGQWSGVLIVEALKRAWKVDDAAISNYRRTGRVANAACRGDNAELLEDSLGMYETQERELLVTAGELERMGRHGEATRYRDLAQKARERRTELAGLLQHRMTISLEADPRIAGMYAAQLAALEAFDEIAERQRRETEDVVRALQAEIERLNGGVLPAELPDLPAALPSAGEHVQMAVKRYEAEIGARKLAA